MKKYFLGLLAIVFAIAFSAFTKPTNFANEKIFRFDGTGGYQTTNFANVQNPVNWDVVASQGANCTSSTSTVKVCEVQLSDVYYHMETIEDEQVPVINSTGNNPESGSGDLIPTLNTTTGTGASSLIILSSLGTSGTRFNASVE